MLILGQRSFFAYQDEPESRGRTTLARHAARGHQGREDTAEEMRGDVRRFQSRVDTVESPARCRLQQTVSLLART